MSAFMRLLGMAPAKEHHCACCRYREVDSEPITEPPSMCRFCGSTKPMTVSGQNSETFWPQYGCLSCNRWQDKPRLRKP